jgi:hypothetical protein
MGDYLFEGQAGFGQGDQYPASWVPFFQRLRELD